jgi:hypothetical protein
LGICLPFTLISAAIPVLMCFVSLAIALLTVSALIYFQRDTPEYPWWMPSPAYIGLMGLFFGIILALSLPGSIYPSLRAAIGSLALGLSLPMGNSRARMHSSQPSVPPDSRND